MAQVAQGGTVRLTATFEDASGALVDPTSPSVDILDPSLTMVVNDAPLARDSLGQYHYDFSAAADASLGDWIARFTGTISGSAITGDEPFTVVLPGSINAGAPWLITYQELVNSLRLAPGDINVQKEADLKRSIAASSAAVSRYADRDFGAPNVTEERTYEYDGSGLLEVDDFHNATAVVLSSYGVDSTLDATEWRAQPYGALAQSYILLPAYMGGISGEMGFTRNLDRIFSERGWMGSVLVKITATWGWPTVPEDVKQAVIWTAAEAQEDPGSKRSEAIAGYSYSRDTPGLPEQTAIPQRAVDLLTPYIRLKVG